MNQYNLALISHEVDQQTIYQRAGDGYFNATAMCKATGKKISHYFENSNTKAFLDELSSDAGIPASVLVQVIKGGEPHLQGTWVHPDVAIHLAQWCSPKFAVQVNKFIREWMQGENPLQKALSQWQFYIDRASLVNNSVPQNYFSVFKEAAPLMVTLIQSGVLVDDKTVPDISIGSHWATYWRKQELALEHGEPTNYQHFYPESYPQSGSNPQIVKAYPLGALSAFRIWLEGIYLPEKFPKYMLSKLKQGHIESGTANKLIDAFSPKRVN
ncbi:MAG: KilA-N domain-containing protein [Psychrobacter alimentarius]